MRTIIVLLLFLTSCAHTAGRQPVSDAVTYAPRNEQSRPRTVSYLNQGAGFIIKSRRTSSYKKMYQDCGGPYDIISEGPRSEGGVAMPVGNSSLYSSTEYWYITYQCAPKEAKE
jgi:outer membrane biogenesis lipoprotein LolB